MTRISYCKNVIYLDRTYSQCCQFCVFVWLPLPFREETNNLVTKISSKGHSQLAHMRVRFHVIANLHITETRSILFLTKHDKNNIVGWAKAHSETGFSVNDWISSKTLRRLKRNSRCTLISGWGELFKVRKLVSRSSRSQSWLCPFNCIVFKHFQHKKVYSFHNLASGSFFKYSLNLANPNLEIFIIYYFENERVRPSSNQWGPTVSRDRTGRISVQATRYFKISN